jgi:hypothetical protein
MSDHDSKGIGRTIDGALRRDWDGTGRDPQYNAGMRRLDAKLRQIASPLL